MSTFQATVEGPSLSDRTPFGPLQRRVTILCAVIAMLDGFDTQSIAYVAPRIAEDWAIASSEFGIIFAVGLFGLMAGAFVLSPAADRYGRKKIIILSTLIFGLFALLTAWASNMTELMVYRFITGVGLGAAMPNIIALTSEYAPTRLRATLVTVMFCGFPLGSMIGGFISNWLIATYDWHSVFVLGGVLPLLMVPVLLYALPESLRYLAGHDGAARHCEKVARQAYPGEDVAAVMRSLREERNADGQTVTGFRVFELFRRGRMSMTILIWLAFFLNLLVMYFLVNWLPTLLKNAGLPLGTAILSTAMLNMGGVIGALVLGRLIDKFTPYVVLGSAYAAAAVFIAVMAYDSANLPLLLAGATLSGFSVVGAQIGCNALAASLYPTDIRATGVGWALGVGRMGAIVGPLAGGALLAAAWSASSIILATAVPALLAALAIFALGRVQQSKR